MVILVFVVLLGAAATYWNLNREVQGNPIVNSNGSFAQYIAGLNMMALKETSSSLELGTVLQIDMAGQRVHVDTDVAFMESASFQDAPWTRVMDYAVFQDSGSVNGVLTTAKLPGSVSFGEAGVSVNASTSIYAEVSGLEKQELSNVELREAKIRKDISSDLNTIPGVFVVQKVLRVGELKYVFSDKTTTLTEAEFAKMLSGEITTERQSNGKMQWKSMVIAVQPAYVFGGSEVSADEVNLVAEELNRTGIESTVEDGVAVAKVEVGNAMLVKSVAEKTLKNERLSSKTRELNQINTGLIRDLGETRNEVGRVTLEMELRKSEFQDELNQLKASVDQAEKLRDLMRKALPTIQDAYDKEIREDLKVLNTTNGRKLGVSGSISRELFIQKKDAWRGALDRPQTPKDRDSLKLMDRVDQRIREIRDIE